MWDSLVSFLDREMIIYLGSGLGAMIGAGFLAFRAITKGAKPSTAAVASAIEHATCGAPQVATIVRDIRAVQREMHSDLERVQEMVTRIEDRTRR